MKKIYVIASLAFATSAFAQYTKLHVFNGTMGDAPYGSLISDGTSLYGMTYEGGTQGGFGVIFKIKQDGTGYDTLRCFNGNGSINEGSPLMNSFIFDSTKTFLYGMTPGPAIGGGGIFKIKPDGTAFDTLKKFRVSAPFTDGTTPYGSLISDGTYLYGMTTAGGTHHTLTTQGDGVIFKIKFDGSGFTKLHDFDSTNGRSPMGDLLLNGGFLYGMAFGGGAHGGDFGVIFKIKPDGSGYDTLLNFNGANGANPVGSLIYDGTFLYGMTQMGGTGSYGNIFKIKPDGSGYDTLLNFRGANGATPLGSLISDGTYLYGTTNIGGTGTNCTSGAGGGVIFKIKPDGSGYTDLYDFGSVVNDGSAPDGALIFDATKTCLYGTLSGYYGNSDGIFSYCLSNTTSIPTHNQTGLNTFSYGNAIITNGAIAQGQQLKVINTLGQVVLTTALQNNIVTNLPSGIYTIQVIDNTGSIIEIKKCALINN